MKSTCLLYLTTQHMTASRWHAGRFVPEACFTNDEDGHQGFAAYRATHPNDIYRLLVNLADEAFQIVTIPRLFGQDRRLVIERKRRQFLPRAPFSASLSLGPETSDGKGERLLLTALTNPLPLAPWLAVIAATEGALAGIHSLPFLSPALLTHLHIPDGQCLLVTLQGLALRQSYLENGRLIFSRLTLLRVEQSEEDIARTFFGEISALLNYLRSQRFVDRNHPLTAHLVAPPQLARTLGQHCTDTDALRFVVHEMDGSVEALCLPLMDKKAPPPQFATDAHRHTYHLNVLRRSLLYAGAAVFLAGGVTCSVLLAKTFGIRQKTELLRQETAHNRAQYDAAIATLPSLPIGHDDVRRLVDRHAELERHNLIPNPLFVEISQAISAAPIIELEDIEWTAPSQGGQGLPGAPRMGAWETALIHGRLRSDTNATPRELLRAFDHFISALAGNPALQISVQRHPFGINSESTPHNDEPPTSDQPRPSFSLQIIRRTTA